MRVRILTLLAALVCGLPSLARDKTDVLVMKNGDRLTCEIKGLIQGVLYIGLDYITGTQAVEWSKVARLESSQPFIVKTEDGSVYSGTLRAVEAAGKRPLELEVTAANETSVSLDTDRIIKMDETSASIWRRFNGQVNIGVIYANSNDSTQYNLSASSDYVRPRWSAGASLNSSLSSNTGVSASTRNALDVDMMHLLTKKNYFYTGGVDFLQSSSQGIALQTSVYGGLGRYLRNTNRATISVVGGLGWQRTGYTPETHVEGQQNLLAGLVAANVQLFRFNKTSLAIDAYLFPALTDPGRMRTNVTASYYLKFFSNFTWNLSFYGNWDNQPPPGFASSDYGFSSGLGWTFGVTGIR